LKDLFSMKHFGDNIQRLLQQIDNVKVDMVKHEENKCLPAANAPKQGLVVKSLIKCFEAFKVLQEVPKKIVFNVWTHVTQQLAVGHSGQAALTYTSNMTAVVEKEKDESDESRAYRKEYEST